MSVRTDRSATDGLRDEAVAWLVRVQSDTATGEDWIALTAWLEVSEDHQVAFEAVESLAAEISDRAGEIAPRLAPSTGEVLAFRPRREGLRRGGIVAALAAAAAVLVVSPLAWRASLGTETVYQTDVGQTREIALSDGSHIRLNGGSRMSVRLGWRTRRVEMAQAEAAFSVAKDPNRPFIISVGDQQVRVVGTEFNIAHYDQTVVVSVRRGVVDVRQPALGPTPIARLGVGDTLRHTEGTRVSQHSKVDPDAAFAWTQGRLVCDERRLGEIVADLNRRFGTQVSFADTTAADLRFSGVIALRDQEAVLAQLSEFLPIHVRHGERHITIASKPDRR